MRVRRTPNVCPVEMSGLLFVALAVVWAVVLIPKALRHHDELAKTRSVDTVSESMRVLARREQPRRGEGRLVVDPASRAPALEVPAPRPSGKVAARTRPSAKAAKAAARRRRRILVLLLLVDACCVAGAALGRLPLWAPVVALAVTVGFLVLARVTVRRERAQTAPRPVAAPIEVPAVEPEPASAPERNDQGLAVVSGLEDTSSFPMDLVGADVDEDLWDPLPMTLP